MRPAAALPDRLGGAPDGKRSLRLWLRLLTCSHTIEQTIAQRLRDEFGSTLPRFDMLSALDRAGSMSKRGRVEPNASRSRWEMVCSMVVVQVSSRSHRRSERLPSGAPPSRSGRAAALTARPRPRGRRRR